MIFSERRLEILLIRAMRGNNSPAQPNKESISLLRLKLPSGERGSLGRGDDAGEIGDTLGDEEIKAR
jgi:hypothetical protein